MVIRNSGQNHTFRVYLPEAQFVELVGTFTGWRSESIRMQREDTGWWCATVELSAGDHDFSYLINGSAWLADYAASGVRRNGFGGWVSQVHVPAVIAATVRRAASVAA